MRKRSPDPSEAAPPTPAPADRAAVPATAARRSPPHPRLPVEHLAPAGNAAIARLVQAKLAVGPPGDEYERAADRAADGAAGPIAALPAGGASGGLPVASAAVEQAVAGGGRPLEPGVRTAMEDRFATDFSAVRVHPDSEAPGLVGARAFTAGHDIVLAPSAYDPGSAAGRWLLAHELTHVVQQRGGAARIQRDGGEPTPANQELLRLITYQATVLRQVPPLPEGDQRALAATMSGMPVYDKLNERDRVRNELQRLQEWLVDIEGRNAALARGEELAGGTGATPEQVAGWRAEAEQKSRRIDELTAEIQPDLAALGTDEASLRRRVEEEFPELWKRRALQIVGAMLNENEAMVRQEQARYPGNASTVDIHALVSGDAALKRTADELARLVSRRDAASAMAGPLPPGGAPEGEAARQYADVQALNEQVSEVHDRLQAQRATLAAAHPILYTDEYVPGMLQNLPEGRLREITGGWTTDVLENIADTRGNVADGTIKVWDLRDVPALTWTSLGVRPDGPLGQVVERQHQRERSEEQALQIAIAALAITAGVVATIATAGGASVLAAAATGVGIGVGLAQLGHDIARFRAENAASGVSLDPALADISVREPELLPIILDLVGTGLDIAGAIAIVRGMSAAERALAAEGRLVSISPQTRRLALSQPALLAEYERVANQKMPALVADVLSRQRSTPGRVRLGQLRQQFDRLRRTVGEGQQLTTAQRQQANDILREARDLARADFDNVRNALWRRMRQDADLLRIEQQMQQAGDAAAGGRALQVNTQTSSGTTFEPLGVEHRTRLSDNPWGYNDPANLIVTDASQNEQFLEALRQHGFVWSTDEIEEFVVRHGLNDQGIDFAPQAR